MAAETDARALARFVASDAVEDLKQFRGNVHAQDALSRTVLMLAALARREDMLRFCITSGVGRTGVNRVQLVPDNRSALMFACGRSDSAEADTINCVRVLLESGADPLLKDAQGNTALHLAVAAKHVNIVTYLASLVAYFPTLFEARNSMSSRPVDVAREQGSVDIVNILEAREQGRAGLYLHPLVVRPDLFGSLMPRELTMSRYVVVGQSKEARRVVTTVGIFLCEAARGGHFSIVTREDLAPYVATCRDADGRTVLMSACARRRIDIVRWILATFDPTEQVAAVDDFSCSVLHFAVCAQPKGSGVTADAADDPACALAVLRCGANVYAEDASGLTAAGLARLLAYGRCAKVLHDAMETPVTSL